MLKDKTVLVTGASRGVGKETARACAKAGAKVILHFNVNQDEAVALAKEIDAVGCIAADLSQKGAADRVWLKAKTMAGSVDAVVNNAGVYRETPLHNAQSWEAGWAEQLQVNVMAPCELMRNAINDWGSSGGAIVNIASRAAYRGDGPDHAGYAASKGALVAASKTLARAHAHNNVLIYTLTPGWIETDMAPSRVEARAAAVADIPLGRVAQPQEIAAMATFLLSGQCGSATGSVIDINGASFMR
ncbi:SDR family oxidoreductase [Hyphobacterium sp. CCMP332]|uniref:SDR family NAD(P)-dependent oxidoreductase n=1 Tax=Hyphobacterium sp. CCMP332 TaxID=2749086 RepID=UPI00164FAEA4|nr:SDR family oxidoreductase [Hyphobacterium sp. CCMP332]QNL19542.1 SDR family oxidoreductase [Hyphobacterium sp. CCMP332]